MCSRGTEAYIGGGEAKEGGSAHSLAYFQEIAMTAPSQHPLAAPRVLFWLLCIAVVLPVWGEEPTGRKPEGPSLGDQPIGALTSISDERIEQLLALHHTETDNVRLVLLPVVVTNRKGRIIEGLELADFELLEDYVPQQIEHVYTEHETPISLAFLLDLSGSMLQAGKLEEAKQAIRVFVESLQKDDRFGLIGFADHQVTWITEWTADISNFKRRLDVQEAYGQTALYDAVAATPELVDSSIEGRKAIILITDGNDNASHLDTFRAVTLARSVSVPIYTIGFSSLTSGVLPRGQTPKGLLAMARFSEETGGNLFVVHDPSDLKEAVLRIQSELRTQYIVTYRPTRQHWDGTFRRVKLTAGQKRVVHTRSGYYALP